MDGASAALSDKPSSAPPSQQGGVRPEHPHEGQPAPSQEMAASFLKTSSLSVRKKLIQQTGFPLYSTSHGFHEEDVKKKLQQFTGGSIDLRKEDCGIGILTFNNPSKKNAFSGVMMLQLLERVIDLENWKEGKGLIVCGAKNTFCSGSDLSAVKSLGTSQIRKTTYRLVQSYKVASRRGWSRIVHVYAKHLNKIYEAAFNKCCFDSRKSNGWRSRVNHSMRFQANDSIK
ncbi:ethylmalonyl-CoA decarboxylase isoform X6 [Notamacropus eugenii]|uniref:ethylmalonyl-CoA decarboxylase isoform X6 n=1 Tax=Notamacropus eugenii TaxID=9315 RepID=UPI003B674506